MNTARRLLVLLALAASVLAVQSASASNSPNMRIDYSLSDTTSGRTHSDIAFWGNIAVAGSYDGFRVFNTDTHLLLGTTSAAARRTTSRSTRQHNGHLLLFHLERHAADDGDTVCSHEPTQRHDRLRTARFEGIRIFDLADPSAPADQGGLHGMWLAHAHARPGPANNRL